MKKITGLILLFSLMGCGTAIGEKPKPYRYTGTCAFLPASRATEFHGSVNGSTLNLAMAGNQWVVFQSIMQGFNKSLTLDAMWPAPRDNDEGGFTRHTLTNGSNRYFIELIPPGQLRKQIKSGCMLLGNEKARNFLPLNLQIEFDVFSSTNEVLMQDLADAGFINESVPYIANRLDLMVKAGNLKGIGTTSYTNDPAFDVQFDLIMDILSGDIKMSALDHINEGIHNAVNGYLKRAHQYIINHDRSVKMKYTFADGTVLHKKQRATQWIQMALNVVAKPMNGSPGSLRLTTRDAGETHVTHSLAANGCGVPGAYRVCEFALLNKRGTYETRIHHVETPKGLINAYGYTPIDAGFVWVTELAYQINSGNKTVTGIGGQISPLGIPNTRGVNRDTVYSVALLATAPHEKQGRKFISYLRGRDGQARFESGGFTRLTYTVLSSGHCYSVPINGKSTATPRGPKGCK